MPVYRLSKDLVFPPPHLAEEGLLAVGGDLSEARLLLAYQSGIFPWYSDGEPILWWSPDPRTILTPEEMHVSHRLRRTLRSGRFRLSFDEAFPAVVDACASVPRRYQKGTWITSAMRDAYVRLHETGFAHSVEAWQGDELAGGLYGVSLGGCFFGESMFSRADDASKAALAALADHMRRWGMPLIDCQMPTAHLHRLGARDIPRSEYLRLLRKALRHPTRHGPWQIESPGPA